jgi:hypothetical protein
MPLMSEFEHFQANDYNAMNPFEMDLNMPPVPELVDSLEKELAGKTRVHADNILSFSL